MGDNPTTAPEMWVRCYVCRKILKSDAQRHLVYWDNGKSVGYLCHKHNEEFEFQQADSAKYDGHKERVEKTLYFIHSQYLADPANKQPGEYDVDPDLAPRCAICGKLMANFNEQHSVTFDERNELTADLCAAHLELYEILVSFCQSIGREIAGSAILNFMKINQGRR